MTLRTFLTQVDDVIDQSIFAPNFHPIQTELLNRTVQRYRPLAASNPMGDPTWRSILYLVVRAWGRSVDAQVIQTAAFSTLYLLAADLLDDVEDGDLAGKAHEHVEAGVAINDAVTLLCLALERLAAVIELEPNLERRQSWLRLFNRTSLRAVSGQHRDLLGPAATKNPREVLEMMRERNSSLSMIMECASMLARCSCEQVSIYRALGDKITTCCTIREELSDIFGKETSPDLEANKVTFPIACFLDTAPAVERSRFEFLRSRAPESLREIRTLLYESGAVSAAADTMDQLRVEIHELFALLENPCAEHRCLLSIVDSVAESVYEPDELEITRAHFEPKGAWHDWVRTQLDCFVQRTIPLGLPGRPTLRPWHLPQWMYDAGHDVVYYPDLEELAEEILPELADTLGIDEGEVSRMQWQQSPGLIAHEMFHYWRGASGRLTRDYWHEEWVANTLAVAYLKQFDPLVLTESTVLANRVLSHNASSNPSDVLLILETCGKPNPGLREHYGLSARDMTLVTLEMVRRLAAMSTDLPSSIVEFLDTTAPDRHGVAA